MKNSPATTIYSEQQQIERTVKTTQIEILFSLFKYSDGQIYYKRNY
jgi:hypothetical protein